MLWGVHRPLLWMLQPRQGSMVALEAYCSSSRSGSKRAKCGASEEKLCYFHDVSDGVWV